LGGPLATRRGIVTRRGRAAIYSPPRDRADGRRLTEIISIDHGPGEHKEGIRILDNPSKLPVNKNWSSTVSRVSLFPGLKPTKINSSVFFSNPSDKSFLLVVVTYALKPCLIVLAPRSVGHLLTRSSKAKIAYPVVCTVAIYVVNLIPLGDVSVTIHVGQTMERVSLIPNQDGSVMFFVPEIVVPSKNNLG